MRSPIGEEEQLYMSGLTKEKKVEIISEFGGNAANTGSTEAQIAMLTERINHIASHMKGNKKDHHSNRSLLKLVGRRKRYLAYYSRTNLEAYRALIAKLGLRK